MIHVQELINDRKTYIIERDPASPKIHTGKISGIVRNDSGHFLRVKTENETIRVHISGRFLPDVLLNNSIFFDAASAMCELEIFKEYLRTHKKYTPKLMGF